MAFESTQNIGDGQFTAYLLVEQRALPSPCAYTAVLRLKLSEAVPFAAVYPSNCLRHCSFPCHQWIAQFVYYCLLTLVMTAVDHGW